MPRPGGRVRVRRRRIESRVGLPLHDAPTVRCFRQVDGDPLYPDLDARLRAFADELRAKGQKDTAARFMEAIDDVRLRDLIVETAMSLAIKRHLDEFIEEVVRRVENEVYPEWAADDPPGGD